MKNLFYIIGLALVLVSCGGQINEKSDSFIVYGNCDMCKKTIESSLTPEMGIYSASWDKNTHKMAVSFDSAKIDLKAIHAAIAASGYDTELVSGDDEEYSALHECCQYERKK